MSTAEPSRIPPPSTDSQIAQILAAALGVYGVLISGVVVYGFLQWSSLQRELSAAQARNASLENEVTNLKHQLAALPVGGGGIPWQGLEKLLSDPQLAGTIGQIAGQLGNSKHDFSQLLQDQKTQQALELGLKFLEAYGKQQTTAPAPSGASPGGTAPAP